MKKILVVDDEADVVDMIAMNLQTAGYEVLKAYDGETGLERALSSPPSLVVLDLMLPKRSGLEVCTALRQDTRTAQLPILMLTAKGEEADRVAGLEAGADDYVVKPFSVRELNLRVTSILRRREPRAGQKPRVMELGDIVLDEARHTVSIHKNPAILTPTEFKLLAVLMERQGVVQTREVLLSDVWEYDQAIDTRTVDTHVRRLREKLGDVAHYIDTIRGVGYRIREDLPKLDVRLA